MRKAPQVKSLIRTSNRIESQQHQEIRKRRVIQADQKRRCSGALIKSMMNFSLLKG